MMEYIVCKVNPKTSFHIGVKEGGLEETLHHIPSDTLFSAFCNVYRLIYGKEKLEALLQKFNENPPFIFSSVYPTINGKLLFPLPKNIILKSKDDEKKLKKVEFISEDIFRKVLEGELPEISERWILQDGKVIVAGADKEEKIWMDINTPRVTIDRITIASQIYYMGEVKFKEKLFFLIDLRENEYKKEVETTIRVMGDEGIGGERTYGKGLFKVEEFEKIKFDEIENPWYITLSMFYPRKEEITGIEGYFEIVERGGWVYSLEEKYKRRKFIRMFAEGSVFNRKITGKLVKVAEGKHDVYRFGYAFPLPIKVIK